MRFLCLVVIAFAILHPPVFAQDDNSANVTPTQLVQNVPRFWDDLDLKEMDVAIDRQLRRWTGHPLSGSIQFGETIYKKTELRRSLRLFSKGLKRFQSCLKKQPKDNCNSDLHQYVVQNFNVYEPKLTPEDPNHGKEKPAFFTGYYTPEISASREKTDTHKFAVYSKPQEEHLRTLTRNQIDFKGMLEGEGYEMFYSNDLYLLYLLHIEGGGKTAFLKDQEGKDYYLSYDGTNSQPFRFISTYMKEKGMLTDDLSIKAQKDYLAKHPEVQEEVFSSCANYVYFKKTTTPPLGSDNVSLTDNRSIATDKNLYAQKGVLTFVESRRPLEGQDPGDKDLKWQEFSRFFIDQDTGGAIRGKARADLYFGLGEYAELASHTQKEYGRIFFLMPKDI